MGHWRHLRSEKFKNKQYKYIWIPNYLKGQGLEIKNTYKVNISNL